MKKVKDKKEEVEYEGYDFNKKINGLWQLFELKNISLLLVIENSEVSILRVEQIKNINYGEPESFRKSLEDNLKQEANVISKAPDNPMSLKREYIG